MVVVKMWWQEHETDVQITSVIRKQGTNRRGGYTNKLKDLPSQ